MVLARSGADYTWYITVKERAQENDEDNSGWMVGGGWREKCIKDFKDSFVWLLNERKRNKDPG